MSYPVQDNQNGEVAAQSSVQFDIKKFVYKLIGFLPWIIISVLISYSAAKLYLRYTPQMHRVAAFLLIKDNEESSPDYNVLRELGVITSSKEIQNQIDILQSYDLSESVVDSLNLEVRLSTVGRIASLPLYGKNSPAFIHVDKSDTLQFTPGYFPVSLETDSLVLINNGKREAYHYNDTFLLSGKRVCVTRNYAMKADDNGYNLIVQDRHSISVALRTAVTITKAHDPGGIVEIAMLDQSSARAKDIINTLIESFNTAGVTDKNSVGFKTRHFLNERVDSVAAELDVLEEKGEAFKKQNKITDITNAGGQYLAEAMKYDDQMAEQSGKFKLLESLEAFIQSSKNYTDIIPSANGLTDGTLAELIKTHNSDVLSYQEQIKISTLKDPLIARLKNKITDDKQNILKNIESIRTGYDVNYGQLSSRKNNFDALLYNIPEQEREYLKLQRQIGVKEHLYLYLLQKKEEIELSLNSTINNTRIVDAAFDQGIVSPKSDQVIMFALLVGVIAPIIVMLLLDFFDNKISDRREIEEAIRVPIIGELAFNSNIKNKVIHAKSRSSMAEQFRLVSSNLRYIASEKASKI
ncbi:MAG: GNVR domain-containing protein, partial [Panacibacter sp.]